MDSGHVFEGLKFGGSNTKSNLPSNDEVVPLQHIIARISGFYVDRACFCFTIAQKFLAHESDQSFVLRALSILQYGGHRSHLY